MVIKLLKLFFLSFELILLFVEILFLLLEKFFLLGNKVFLLLTLFLDLFLFVGLVVEFVLAFLILLLEFFDLFLKLLDELDVVGFVVFLHGRELLILLLKILDEILILLNFVLQVFDLLFHFASRFCFLVFDGVLFGHFLLQGFELGFFLEVKLIFIGVFDRLLFKLFL